MRFLPKINLLRSWNPSRKREAFVALLLAKRRRARASAHGDVTVTVPAAPDNLVVWSSSLDFTLQWDDVSLDETGFRVYRRAFDDPYDMLAELSANQTIYSDGNVELGVNYSYYVVAFNAAGESAPSNVVSDQLFSGA